MAVKKSRIAAFADPSGSEFTQQLRNGDPDCWASLFTKYSSMVFGIARRMLRDDGEAEEVVQQVFLDVYRAVHQFDPTKASFKTWLLQFAYHRAMNRKKHLKAKYFYSFEVLDESKLPADFSDMGRLLKSPSPEIVRLITQLLACIKPRQREAITLTFFEGLTARQISNKTGETPTVVRHNLYRGLSKLRSVLLNK